MSDPSLLAEIILPRGAGICAVCPDLGSLQAPYLYSAEHVASLRQVLTNAFALCEALIATSEEQKSALEYFALTEGLALPPVILMPHLRSEDVAMVRVAEEYLFAPDAFDEGQSPDLLYRLLQKGAPLPLYVTGPVAAEHSAAFERLSRDQNTRGGLHYIERLSGEELTNLAQGARLILSTFEGRYEQGLSAFARIFTKELFVLNGKDDNSRLSEKLLQQAPEPEKALRASDFIAELLAAREVLLPHPPLFGMPHSARTWAACFAEGWGSWSGCSRPMTGREARLKLDLRRAVAEKADDVIVGLKLEALQEAQLPFDLEITTKGRSLFKAKLSNNAFPRHILLHLLPSDWSEGASAELEITTQFPSRLGVSEFTLMRRTMGNPLNALKAEEWGDGSDLLSIDLTDPHHRALVAPHLNWDPAWGVGSHDGRFDLLLPLLPKVPGQRVTLRGRAIASTWIGTKVTVHVNGKVVHKCKFRSDETFSTTFDLPAELLAINGPQVMHLECDAASLPRKRGLGLCETIGGCGILEVEIQPASKAEE